MLHILFFNLLFFTFFSDALLLTENGKWDFNVTQECPFVAASRSLFKESFISVKILCESTTDSKAEVEIIWMLTEATCWEDNVNTDEHSSKENLQLIYYTQNHKKGDLKSIASTPKKYHCTGQIVLDELKLTGVSPDSSDKMPKPPENTQSAANTQKKNEDNKAHRIFTITKDGIYLLSLNITPVDNNPFKAEVHIEMRGEYGYLSAAAYPLLPFYEAMCVVYVIFAIVWLVVSFLQWRDLLRVQFWIGAVILIGMVEKAMFFEVYNSINSSGEMSLWKTVFIAELVSAAKRTLARILVIIVSLGYGIVKPRLGSHLPKIIATGVAFFILASIEAYTRVTQPANHPSSNRIFAGIPLALLDSFICWKIFDNLVQTTRTLRLRRNLVKLTLYNHFTNTLIFTVVASTILMLYTIKAHQPAVCFTEWKELWVDDAGWHLLFSIILLVIMILWRPTNNNQRYAFSPLLDAPDDDDDEDEEVEHFVNDAYGVKMRGTNLLRSESPKPKNTNNEDEDLKWVEENVPPCLIDSTFPILDSDEEIMNTKFEISKME